MSSLNTDYLTRFITYIHDGGSVEEFDLFPCELDSLDSDALYLMIKLQRLNCPIDQRTVTICKDRIMSGKADIFDALVLLATYHPLIKRQLIKHFRLNKNIWS